MVISGFSDEISDVLDTQLQVVRSLGMDHISIRGIDGKNIGDYSLEQFESDVLPQLQKHNVKVSSIGSPVGKVFVDDEEGFQKQLIVLDTICRIANLLQCKYIRIFSFFIKKGLDYNQYKDIVIAKISQFAEIASKYDVILLHENEKDIFGDTDERCKIIFDEVGSPYFKGIFDFANFVQCDIDTMKAYTLLKEHILYFHIKDASYGVSHNVLCGTGDGHIEEILTLAINDGYDGFLTLEPHLAMFGSLQSLELEEAESVIDMSANITGEQGYQMQYNAINDILAKITSAN